MWFLGPTWEDTPNRTSSGSSVFVGPTVVTKRQTDTHKDHETWVTNNRLCLLSFVLLWPNNKSVCVQPRQLDLSTKHCLHLLLNAMLRRRCCWTPGALHCRSLSPACTALSSKPATSMVEWWDRQTDGHLTIIQTLPAYYAAGGNKREAITVRQLRVLSARPSAAPESLSVAVLPLSSPRLSSSVPPSPTGAALQSHAQPLHAQDAPAPHADNTHASCGLMALSTQIALYHAFKKRVIRYIPAWLPIWSNMYLKLMISVRFNHTCRE